MNRKQLEELLYQAFETEKGGVLVYEAALKNIVNDDLKEEFEKYHEQTKKHVQIMQGILEGFGLDPDLETPGRKIVQMKGRALVDAIEEAAQGGDKKAAELVAVECVIDAETKDHQNWELMGKTTKELHKKEAKLLEDAVKEVEKQEDEHFYHSAGWARELWIDYLGLPAILPPPEEKKHVLTEVQAGKVKEQRDRMLHKMHARR